MGERIANYLLNKISSTTKMDIDEIMKFLGRDVWYYLFGKSISKLQTNRKGTFLIDTDTLSIQQPMINNKYPTPEETINTLYVMTYISGIIKGVLSCFNVDCIVNPDTKQNIIYQHILNNNKDPENTPCAYSFTITLLNNLST